MTAYEIKRLDNGWLLNWHSYVKGVDARGGHEVFTTVDALMARVRELLP